MRATAKPSQGVIAALGAIGDRLALGLDRTALQRRMPAGAARNALDCAFWDLEAKRAGKPVHELAGLPAPQPLTTAYTISLGTPRRWRRPRGARPRASCSRSSSAAPGDPAAHRRGAARRAAVAS